MTQNPDSQFARFALREGFISRTRLDDCLREIRRLAEEGVSKRLPELVVEKRYLTRRDVKSILDRQARAVLQCPACLRKFVAHGRKPGKAYTCRRCGARLQSPASIGFDRLHASIEAREECADDLVGKLIGDALLLERIGAGGMGLVYLAHHRLLERKVAVKILPRILSIGSDEYRARFVREARAACSLSHPNIVEVLDVGRLRGDCYIVMEHLPSETLVDRLRRGGPLGVREATRVVREVALALGAAHKAGVIHRDVKPSNIFLCGDGEVKIGDFGLARNDEDTGLTTSGQLLGTPAYMSPEQARGEEVLPESDIYSLGIVYHECVLGAAPYAGSPVSVLQRHASEEEIPVAPIKDRQLGASVTMVLRKMVAKRPGSRYGSARLLAGDLEAVLSGNAPPPASRDDAEEDRPSDLARSRGEGLRKKRRHRAMAATVATVIAATLVAAGVVAWLIVRFSSP